MKLFAELYMDEDVSALTATLLRSRGLNVVTALSEHMLGQDDAAQLARATALGRCIVTHNRLDFEQLHRRYLAAGQEHAGIVIAARRPPHELATRIVTLLNALTADEIHNQLLYV